MSIVVIAAAGMTSREITASSGLIQNIIARMPTTTASDVMICVSDC